MPKTQSPRAKILTAAAAFSGLALLWSLLHAVACIQEVDCGHRETLPLDDVQEVAITGCVGVAASPAQDLLLPLPIPPADRPTAPSGAASRERRAGSHRTRRIVTQRSVTDAAPRIHDPVGARGARKTQRRTARTLPAKISQECGRGLGTRAVRIPRRGGVATAERRLPKNKCWAASVSARRAVRASRKRP